MELQRLKQRATLACESRGHQLKAWFIRDDELGNYAETKCRHCHLIVHCNVNLSDIRGPAIDVNCTKNGASQLETNAQETGSCLLP